MERASLKRAGCVAEEIRDNAWREMSLRLVDAVEADTAGLAERPGFGERTGESWLGNARGRPTQGAGGGPVAVRFAVWERWLEAPDA